jgi:hypothetical protein
VGQTSQRCAEGSYKTNVFYFKRAFYRNILPKFATSSCIPTVMKVCSNTISIFNKLTRLPQRLNSLEMGQRTGVWFPAQVEISPPSSTSIPFSGAQPASCQMGTTHLNPVLRLSGILLPFHRTPSRHVIRHRTTLPLPLFALGNRIGVLKYKQRKHPHSMAYSSILGRWFCRPINSSFKACQFRL